MGTITMDTPAPDTLAALDKVDVSVVETLTGIARDQDAVRLLLAKAAERKDKVPPAVYARVAQDYEGRLAALEDRARPLREQGRAQLVDLLKLHGQIKSDWEAAQLALQELEFRHEVGELSPEEFEPRRKTAAGTVEERQRTFERVDGLRVRFEGVLASDPTPPAATLPPVVLVPAVESAPPESTPPESTPPAAPSAPAADRTESMPIPANLPVPVATPGPAATPPRPGASTLPPPTGEIGTMLVLKPMLIEETPTGPGRSFPLGPVTTIGRTPDNQIAADVRELSRHHARIEQRDNGSFVMIDLNSGNGTFVNDQRVTEHRLTPGDRIQIGTLRFVYQAS